MSSGLFEDEIHGREGPEGKLSKGKNRQRGSVPNKVRELHQNTKGLSQVVVKVSSYTKDRGRAGAHADYVTRRDKEAGDLPVEMSDGSVIRTAEDVSEVLDDWFARKEARKDARRTVNIVLSSPEGANVSKVTAAVREFAGNSLLIKPKCQIKSRLIQSSVLSSSDFVVL